ncbi:MAG: class I SAM-dependent methyltransferase, partial [Waddliaceae bacterium]
ICKKLYLKPGMKILDIGCGWGSFAKFAAEKYQAEVVGVTISEEQLELGNQLCYGLPVELRLEDYRDVRGTFDRVVSIGAFEHIGEKNYKTFMNVASARLKEDGLFLLHTIGRNRPATALQPTDPWFEKYIFPNSQLPAASQIAKASEGIFIMEDWHNFGSDYDQTLMAWFKNFDRHWNELKENYDDSFYRMWKYYLLGSAAGFRTRGMQLWQTVFSKHGVPGGYESVR